MTTARKTAVTTLLLVSALGCARHAKVAPPQQAQAPVPPMSEMAHTPALPPLQPAPTPDVTLAAQEESTPPPAPKPKRTTRRRSTVAKTPEITPTATEKPAAAQQPPPAQDATTTNTAPAPDNSPIGQLSSTGETSTSQGRHDVEQLISSIDSGLTNIKRPLSTDEQTTSTQIRTFLTRARQALAVDDLDGAHTLAVKAKVLLDELTKK